MKKALLAVVLLLLILSYVHADTTKDDLTKRVANAANVLQQITSAPDKGIPEEAIRSAKCIVVIPHQVKAGLGFGGTYGKGVATCRTPSGTWSAPLFVQIAGGSWGAQIGGEAVDNVLLIMNQHGVQQLLANKFKIGADVSAAAGPVGRQAEAGTDWKMNAEVLAYSRAKGLFAGVTLNGAVLHVDKDANTVAYGNVDPNEILTGKVQPPPFAEPFLAAVQAAEKQSHASS